MGGFRVGRLILLLTPAVGMTLAAHPGAARAASQDGNDKPLTGEICEGHLAPIPRPEGRATPEQRDRARKMAEGLLHPKEKTTGSLREDLFDAWTDLREELGTDRLQEQTEAILTRINRGQAVEIGGRAVEDLMDSVGSVQDMMENLAAATGAQKRSLKEKGINLARRAPFGVGEKFGKWVKKNQTPAEIYDSMEQRLRSQINQIRTLIEDHRQGSRQKRISVEKLQDQLVILSLLAEDLRSEAEALSPDDPRKDVLETDLLFEIKQEILAISNRIQELNSGVVFDLQQLENNHKALSLGQQSLFMDLPQLRQITAQHLSMKTTAALVSMSTAINQAKSVATARLAAEVAEESRRLRELEMRRATDTAYLTQTTNTQLQMIADGLQHRRTRLPELEARIAESQARSEALSQQARRLEREHREARALQSGG